MTDVVEKVARALSSGGHLGVSLAFEPILATDKGSIPQLKARDTERATGAARAAIDAFLKAAGSDPDAAEQCEAAWLRYIRREED